MHWEAQQGMPYVLLRAVVVESVPLTQAYAPAAIST